MREVGGFVGEFFFVTFLWFASVEMLIFAHIMQILITLSSV